MIENELFFLVDFKMQICFGAVWKGVKVWYLEFLYRESRSFSRQV